MEDITKRQIACLVLGYLKSGNYKVSHKYFHKNCQYFAKFREKKLRISSRVHGLTLEQIIQQYNEICSIVQPRLEDTDYYDTRAFPYQEAISQQLLYLLNYGKPQSVCSTPVTSPVHDENESYHSSMEFSASLDVSTTPLSKLPGNSCETTDSVAEGDRFKKPQIFNDTDEAEVGESSEDADKGISEVVEAFKESLLAREELQERIAHTINEVRCDTLSGCEVEAAVKDIINRTEMDPAFEDLIDEILGVPEATENDKTKRSTSKSNAFTSTPMVNSPSAVQQEAPSSTTSQNETFDNAKNNMIVINSAGLVNSQALPASTSLAMPVNTTTPGVYIDTSTGLNLVGQAVDGQQYILSEADIMSMPVYVCGDKSVEKVMIDESIQVPEKRLKTMHPRKELSNSADKLKQAETLADYITMYSCNNDDTLAGKTVGPPIVPMDVTNTTMIQTDSVQPYAITVLPAPTTEPTLTSAITDTTPDGVVAVSKPAPAATPRSGGRSSHVRALDFQKFHTPRKDTASTPPKTYCNKNKPPGAQKSSKSLFSTGKTVHEPWDSKYRASITKKTTPIEKVEKKQVRAEEEKKGEQSAVHKTEVSPNENVDVSNCSKEKSPRKNPARKAKSKSIAAKKAILMNETTPLVNKSIKSKLARILPEEIRYSEMIIQQNYTVKNVNAPPNYKKKCNMDNMREVKVVIPKDAKVAELVAENDKVILSPSKLNGSKRALVELEAGMPSMVTPESNKSKVEPSVVPSSSTARNITLCLQTPGKFIDVCPKTPSIYTPGVEETPMTKMFNEHTTGVDIAAIPTPNVLLTPNFPLTPFMNAHESYNPPTDYSTSSSYYQPSDTEGNKSIDKLIKECQRLECVVDESLPQVQAGVVSEEVKTAEVEKADKAVVEKMKSMRSNCIAKKNLSLIKKKDENTSSSSDDTSSSSDSSSSEEDADQRNETIMEVNSRYSLRNRTSPQVTTLRGDSETKKVLDQKKASTNQKEDSLGSLPTEDIKSQVSKECPRKDLPEKKEDKPKEDLKERRLFKENTKPQPVQKSTTSKTASKEDLKQHSLSTEDIKPLQKESKLRSISKEDLKLDTGKSKKKVTEKKTKEKQSPTKKFTQKPDVSNKDTVKSSSQSNISLIVTSVPYVPVLNRQAPSDDKNKYLLSDLEMKRKRMVDAIKLDNSDRKTTAVKLPPKKRKTAPLRVLRSTNATNAKLKEDDLHLTSSDEDTSETANIRPFEVVETELHCSNSNPTLSDITLRISDDADDCLLEQFTLKLSDDSDGSKCKLIDEPQDNSKEHVLVSPVLPEETDKKVSFEIDTKKILPVVKTEKKNVRKSATEDKKTTNKNTKKDTKKKPEIKTKEIEKSSNKPLKTNEKFLKVTEKPKVDERSLKLSEKPPKTSEKSSKTTEKPQKASLKEDKPPKNTKDIQSTSRTKQEAIDSIDEAKDGKSNKKGTIEKEAKTELMIGMQKMGFPVIPVDPANSEESSDLVDDFKLYKLEIDPPENIAHCYKYLYASQEESDFDTIVYSEAMSVDGTNSVLTGTKRDVDDDRRRLAKSYKIPLYNDEIDAEVEKEMRVTSYVDLFYFDPTQPLKKETKSRVKEKVQVLHNIVIKNDKRLKTSESSKSTALEDVASRSETKSDNERKRKLPSPPLPDSIVTDSSKKLKLDDQRLLQDVNVDDFLQNLHG